ncbi:hypothetical protein GC167_02360 [bacterium]|nr:hypothetical protein [bacterium]
MSVQLKCRLCDQWYEESPDRTGSCPNCGYPSSDPLSKRFDEYTPPDPKAFSIDWNRSLLPIRSGDSLLIRGFKWMINGMFLVYLLIMGVISYIAVAAIG